MHYAEAQLGPLDLLNPVYWKMAIDAAGKLKQLIHSTSESRIKSRERTHGFEFLSMRANAQTSKGIQKRHLLNIVKTYLVPFAASSYEMKQLVLTLTEFIRDDVEEHQEQFFGLMSKGAYGTTQALFVYYKLRDDGKYNFKRMMFHGRFGMAADIVITHTSKNGFFGSSSKDVISYLPRRGVTAQDIKNLMEIIVPRLANIMTEFAPRD